MEKIYYISDNCTMIWDWERSVFWHTESIALRTMNRIYPLITQLKGEKDPDMIIGAGNSLSVHQNSPLEER